MNTVIPQDVLRSVAEISGTTDVENFHSTLLGTVMKGATNEQATAFLLVAKEYNLNPITKEIYAFPSRGGIQPIVSIDGWLKIINSHAQFDGMEFADQLDSNNNLISVTCRIYRSDRSRSTEVTEYLSECQGTSEPWKKFPKRMLRHKATIQAARYAFGFSGIVDQDEVDRIEPRADDIEIKTNVEPLISNEQVKELRELLAQAEKEEAGMLAYLGFDKIEDITEAVFHKQAEQFRKNIAKKPVTAEFKEIKPGEEIDIS